MVTSLNIVDSPYLEFTSKVIINRVSSIYAIITNKKKLKGSERRFDIEIVHCNRQQSDV